MIQTTRCAWVALGWCVAAGFCIAGDAPQGAAIAPSRDSSPIPRPRAVFGLNFVWDANSPEQNIADLLSRVRPDYIQIWIKEHHGYLFYPTKVGTTQPGALPEALATWRKLTRQHGVALIAHFSGIWDSLAVKQHPEWACVGADGKRDDRITSTFSPYVDSLLIPQVREVLSAYDLDGIWMDGDCWAAKLDYSAAAVDQWKKATGRTVAPKGPSDPHWEEWKEFHRRQCESYLAHWVSAVRESHPRAAICSNWAYGWSMPRPVAARVDWLSGDHSPTSSVDVERVAGRYWSSTALPWELHSWAFNSGAHLGTSIPETPKTAVHLQQEAAVALMLGGGVTLGNRCTGTGYVPDSVIDVFAAVAQFCRERQGVCHRSTSVPQVALLHAETAYLESIDGVWGGSWDPPPELVGTLHALLENHYSVDILAEHQLQPRLKQFPLVVIPDAPRLSDPFRKALVSYVEGGGRLLLLGQRSARLFMDHLGAKLSGSSQPGEVVLANSSGMDARVHGPWDDVTLISAKPIGYRRPTWDRRTAAQVAATLASHGKGQIAAVYGPVAVGYQRTHHPALRQFLGEIVHQVWSDPALTVEAPPCADVALRRTADGRLSLHLLNLSGAQRGKDFLNTDYVPCVGPIRARVRVPERPKRVVWEPGRSPLEWSWQHGDLSVTVPSLHIHGIVLIE